MGLLPSQALMDSEDYQITVRSKEVSQRDSKLERTCPRDGLVGGNIRYLEIVC